MLVHDSMISNAESPHIFKSVLASEREPRSTFQVLAGV